MKKTIWQPLVLGTVLGALAGVATVSGLSFLTPGITENAIGFYGTLLLLSAALGGPLAGVIAPALFLTITTWLGPPDMKALLSDPRVFWSNLLALGTTVALVGFAYRLSFERVKMPARLLAWAGIVLAYYLITIPSSVVPQYFLDGSPVSEFVPAVLYTYRSFFPQAIFDILITSLVFIALPARYTRPLWVAPKKAPEQDGSYVQMA